MLDGIMLRFSLLLLKFDVFVKIKEIGYPNRIAHNQIPNFKHQISNKCARGRIRLWCDPKSE
jgi:hypothetical protein